ncbi:MAG: acyl-CoA thioesterase [Alphaproteobacteria bacterium]|nr:acyl-CoA thioesterase [Alphaproteobacteria bacterium SS10]
MAERPTPPKRADFRQFETVDTRWSDNDMYGHVNNAAFYRFFDTAVNRYLIEAGVLNPVESEVIGLVVETGCQFFAPASFPERLELGIKVAKLGTSSVRYELGVFGQADQPGGELAKAAGFFTHVYVDAKSRRPVPLPGGLRDLLERTLT